MIKVSVIVPVYKVPLDFLRECLDSLVAQTMLECEFILVSDGAPDAECSVCEEYAARDPRFKFFRREHAGVSATRNFGIEQAKGEYISFIDADDTILQDSIKSMYKAIVYSQSDIVFADFYKVFKNKKISYQWNKSSTAVKIPWIGSNIFQRQNAIIQSVIWAKLYKKEFLNAFNLKFFPNVSIGEDHIFNLKAFASSNKIYYLHKVVYNYRQNCNSVTYSYLPNAWEQFKPILNALEKYSMKESPQKMGRDTIDIFFHTWNICYMHPQNPNSIFNRIDTLKKIIKSNYFQNKICFMDFSDLSFIARFDTILFQKKITFSIWLHFFLYLLK